MMMMMLIHNDDDYDDDDHDDNGDHDTHKQHVESVRVCCSNMNMPDAIQIHAHYYYKLRYWCGVVWRVVWCVVHCVVRRGVVWCVR